MTGKAKWWVLAVLLLALYFVAFPPRDVTDGSGPPVQQPSAPGPAERLPTPEGEGLGAVETEVDRGLDVAGREQEMQLRRDREFIERAFPVLSSWDVTAVKPLLSPATREGSTDAELVEVMKVLSERLGALQTFEQPVPTATADSQQSLDRTGRLKHYGFVASYESGIADVDLVLHQLPETSSLYSFNINVP